MDMSFRVRDVMTAQPLVIVGPDDDLDLAGQRMAWTRVRHLPVLEDGALVGILSERDYIRGRREAGATPAPALTVRSAMRSPVAWIGPDEPIESALSLMVSHNHGCLPVMGAEGLVGMVTTTDLLRHQLYSAFEGPAVPPARREPASAPAGRFAIGVEHVAGFQFRVTFDKDHHAPILTDEPAPLGRDSAPNPARLLAAALGTCLSASLRYCLRKEGASDPGVAADVQVEIVRNERKRLRIGRVDVILRTGGAADSQALAACKRVFEDFCVVTESVRQGVEVRVAIQESQTKAASAAAP
jgi:CBS domain-containing protein/uncharacterized OsmC-like protein